MKQIFARQTLFFIVIALWGCRKENFKQSDPIGGGQHATAAQAFLKIPAKADRETQLIAQNLASAELRSHFLEKFAAENGYPVWDKMMANVVPDPLGGGSSSIANTVQINDIKHASSGTLTTKNPTRGFFVIPLRDTISGEIKSYLACEKINDTAYRYHNYNKAQILKTSPLSETQKLNVRPLLGMLAYFERQVNGKEAISYEGAAGKFDFNNVKIVRKNEAVDTTTLKSMDLLKRQVDAIPCKRAILDCLYIYNGQDYDLVIILSDCLTLPDVIVSSTIGGGGNSSGSGGMYTGPIPGSPLGAIYSGGYSGGSGGSGGDGDFNNDPGNGGPSYQGLPSGFYSDPWSVYWASMTSSVGTGMTSALLLLNSLFQLTPDQMIWLSSNPEIANELSLFMQSGSSADINTVYNQIVNLMNNSVYYDFVSNYANNNPNSTVWFANDSWLNNPANINFDLDGMDAGGTYNRLNDAEKALVKQYPVEAAIIFAHKDVAEKKAFDLYGANLLNSKGDAFRHTYFNAMNERDLHAPGGGGVDVAKLFSDAHESDTPLQFALEKQMDLFNNQVGQDLGRNTQPFMFPNEDFIPLIQAKIAAGECRYLAPIDFTDPNYNTTHGITSATQVIPTNQ